MMAFNFKLDSYASFLHQFAQYLGEPIVDGILRLPKSMGEGYFRHFELPEGADALVYDFTLHQDLIIRRQKHEEEYYILIFDDIRQRDGYTVSIGEETAQPTNRNAALYLTSFLFDMEQMLSKGVTIKGMRARLSAGWLKKFLRLSEKRDVLEEYINLKTAGMWFKPVDPAVREPFGELFLPEQAPLLFYQNRVLQIVEAFFSWLYDRSRMLAGQKGLSREDIKSAERIESILTGEETVIPPTIPELAREAMMSESKLKKIFKAVYGMPPYEYFQKHRMQKARTLLLSGKYSIKDVGYTLGYNNLSNFTLAFKKEFGQLPSELLRSVR